MNGFVAGEVRISKPQRNNSNQAQSSFWGDFGKGLGKGGGKSRARTSGVKLPKKHSVHQVTVVALQEYGAFVMIGKGDIYTDGLLHITNVSGVKEREKKPFNYTGEFKPEVQPTGPSEKVEDFLELGQKIWVKIDDVDEDNHKYNVDMRFVHQLDGKDLDRFQAKPVHNLPDNGFVPVKAKKEAEAQKKLAIAAERQELAALAAGKRKRDSESDGEAPDPKLVKAKEKLAKKMEKAAKKLEKLRQLAEEAKKSGKVKEKKAKKKKKDESSDEESDS